MSDTLICDIETYPGFFLVAFKRTSDGKIVTMELSDRSTINLRTLRNVMMQNRIITYNGMNFDIPLIFYALTGASVRDLKRAADMIIEGNVRYWQVEERLNITIPRSLDHIDLMEPQPNAFASLKTLNGRLHGKRMQDLPYPPDVAPTHAQMDELTEYCINDLDATELLFNTLSGALEMRETIGKRYGLDFRSKSDSQMGEAIVKHRVEKATGERVRRVETPPGTTFPYRPPEYLKFERPDLQAILEKLRETQFVVQYNGKVTLPGWLSVQAPKIGDTTYAIGIGGLHSTEKNRAVYADAHHDMIDYDVASYYPSIILASGLYPRSLGRAFLDVYRDIRTERIAAKRAGDKTTDMGLKIALNGIFGKLGSTFSILYAPHLLIAVTLTGQLALLMLIERAESAGIPVVSANTDGVVFRCPKHLRDKLTEITSAWERETGFELEDTPYQALYSQSVNTYIAIKPDGKVKRKGVLANPRAEGDTRTQMMNSPSMNVCADAVVDLIVNGTSIEDYIRGCVDIRDFVTVVNVRGGAIWRGEYLGKVVRYYWAHEGEQIQYVNGGKKVSRTDGCRPLMEFGDTFPDDLNYEAYIQAARDILMDIGYSWKPPVRKRPKVFKRNLTDWLALTAVA